MRSTHVENGASLETRNKKTTELLKLKVSSYFPTQRPKNICSSHYTKVFSNKLTVSPNFFSKLHRTRIKKKSSRLPKTVYLLKASIWMKNSPRDPVLGWFFQPHYTLRSDSSYFSMNQRRKPRNVHLSARKQCKHSLRRWCTRVEIRVPS